VAALEVNVLRFCDGNGVILTAAGGKTVKDAGLSSEDGIDVFTEQIGG
jgi:hypothetical protein